MIPAAMYEPLGIADDGEAKICCSPRWASTSSTATCSIRAARQHASTTSASTSFPARSTRTASSPTCSRATGRTSARSARSSRRTSTSRRDLPRFNFFDMSAPIFTRPRLLPASKINGAADRSRGHFRRLHHQPRRHQPVDRRHSQRHWPGHAACTARCCWAATSTSRQSSIAEHEAAGLPRIGIGPNTRIENAIIDKNARIGNNVIISPDGKALDVDHPLYYIRDGVVIIPKNGVVPHGTVI